VLEVHERIAWPELVLELLSRHQFPRLLQQNRKDLNWLPLHLNLLSILAKFTRSKIEFEILELNGTGGGYWLAHSPSLSSREVVALGDNVAITVPSDRVFSLSIAILSP
jgi:hypothetical protein